MENEILKTNADRKRQQYSKLFKLTAVKLLQALVYFKICKLACTHCMKQ